MTNQLQTFNFEANTVRVELKNGEPLFCLTDVTNILEISNANPSRFNLNEAGIHKMYISYPSGAKQVTFINEPNLYRVIFRSNKKEAVKFQNWVFEEVLPSIRKTGQYRHTITPAQAYQIQKAVKKKCTHNSVHYQTIYHALYDKFVVSSYKDILASDFKTAMAFIAGFELSVITSNAHISSDIIVRLSEQFFKTSNLIQQVRSEYFALFRKCQQQ